MATGPMTAERLREMQKASVSRRDAFLRKIVMDTIEGIDDVLERAGTSVSTRNIPVSFNNVKQDLYEFSWTEIAERVETSLKARGFEMKISENVPRSTNSAVYDVSW